jgi:arylsulfatase
MMLKEVKRGLGVLEENTGPHFFDLHTDPKEEHPMDRWEENAWVRWAAAKVLTDHAATMKKEPPIRPGTPDPYVPAR